MHLGGAVVQKTPISVTRLAQALCPDLYGSPAMQPCLGRVDGLAQQPLRETSEQLAGNQEL